MTKARRIAAWLCGVSVLVLLIMRPFDEKWSSYVNLALVAATLYLCSIGQVGVSDENAAPMGWRARLSLLPECRRALVRSGLGVGLMLLGLVFTLLGRREYFGYLDEHIFLIFVLLLLAIVIGAYWSASYLRCVMNYGKPKSLPNGRYRE